MANKPLIAVWFILMFSALAAGTQCSAAVDDTTEIAAKSPPPLFSAEKSGKSRYGAKTPPLISAALQAGGAPTARIAKKKFGTFSSGTTTARIAKGFFWPFFQPLQDTLVKPYENQCCSKVLQGFPGVGT